MVDEHEADRIVFTNEIIKGRDCWLGRLVAIVLAASGVIVIALPVLLKWLGLPALPGGRAGAVLSFACGAVGLVAGVALWRESVVRSWSIDVEGIVVRDARGQSHRLRWPEVERVRWGGDGAWFLGREDRLFLPWAVVPGDAVEQVVRKIAESLPAFELPVRGTAAVREWLIGCMMLAHVMFLCFLSFSFTALLRFALISKYKQLTSDEPSLFDFMLLLIWILLTLALIIPVVILAGRTCWHDRKLNVS